MEDVKLLSIAIPCYNSEAYMRHCIESLLPGGEEVEILIVDDGSTKDNTAEKVAESLEPSFAGTSLSSIAASVTSYLEIDAWCDDLVFTEQSYIKLQDVMENAGFLETRVTYTAAVDNTYALAIAQ